MEKKMSKFILPGLLSIILLSNPPFLFSEEDQQVSKNQNGEKIGNTINEQNVSDIQKAVKSPKPPELEKSFRGQRTAQVQTPDPAQKPEEEQRSNSLPARLATDYIHSIILASREFYAKQIVGRLAKANIVKASEDWEQENGLPLPAQFLKLSAQNSNDYGIGLKIRLVALNPINKANAPKSDLETLGLSGLSKDSKKPFTWMVQREGTWSFQSIYPDLATSESCVSCHNSHPKSAKKDYEIGDIMGGILINIPLTNVQLNEKGISAGNEVFRVPPQIVSDYVHAILDSDRYIYTKYIIKRMEELKIVEAKESWIDDKALPLPAQFLLNTSRLARKNKVGLNFRLISLWPINFNNSAANEFERNALVSVAINPLRPYMGRLKRGRITYFQAVYPDFAVSQSCVDCHNSHPKSPKRDFQLDDLMGGMVVSFPMRKK